jgi:biopolymer transport protein ExbD
MASIASDSKDKFSLNLYPMVDIFSILICFLLMNYSTEGQSVETKANLELPKSRVKLSLDESASVSITKDEIVVQGSVKIPIGADGDVPEKDRKQGAIMPAYLEFKRVRDSNETLKNRNQLSGLSQKELNVLTLEADKNTQFKLIKRIMLSAQQADFISWKLAVDKAEIN